MDRIMKQHLEIFRIIAAQFYLENQHHVLIEQSITSVISAKQWFSRVKELIVWSEVLISFLVQCPNDGQHHNPMD